MKFPVLVAADAYRGDRFFERDIAQGQRRTGGAHAEHVGVEIRIDRQHGRNDLHVVTEPVRKERANRAVDLARTEDGVFGRASFALDESAGDFSGGKHLFFKIASEREPVDTFARFGGGGGGTEHDVLIAVTNQSGAVCLLREFAGFDDHRAPADL